MTTKRFRKLLYSFGFSRNEANAYIRYHSNHCLDFGYVKIELIDRIVSWNEYASIHDELLPYNKSFSLI